MSIDQLMADAGLEPVSPGIWVRPEAHELRGSCVPGCPKYGFCHCGCGERTALAKGWEHQYGRVKGRPNVFRPGHCKRVPEVPDRRTGVWGVNGVPVERVRPMALWLRTRYGSARLAAEAVGVPESTFEKIMSRGRWGRKRVTPETARLIADGVLAHRQRKDPWQFVPEEDRRLLPKHVRDHMEDVVRREKMRLDTRRQRERRRQAANA